MSHQNQTNNPQTLQRRHLYQVVTKNQVENRRKNHKKRDLYLGEEEGSYSVVAIKALGSILPAFRLQLVSQKRELGILIVTPLPVKTKSDRIEIAQSTDNLSILYEFSAEREREREARFSGVVDTQSDLENEKALHSGLLSLNLWSRHRHLSLLAPLTQTKQTKQREKRT